VLSKYPGQTQFGEPPTDGKKSPTDWGVHWTDFPVMNMHSHGWPLYSAAKLLGVDFREDGVAFKPAIPVAEYEFESPLVGFKKSPKGYSGWYAPAVSGKWSIEITLPETAMANLKQLKINGIVKPLANQEKTIKFAGESTPGQPLHWEISSRSLDLPDPKLGLPPSRHLRLQTVTRAGKPAKWVKFLRV
jgi:hypothetical protein